MLKSTNPIVQNAIAANWKGNSNMKTPDDVNVGDTVEKSSDRFFMDGRNGGKRGKVVEKIVHGERDAQLIVKYDDGTTDQSDFRNFRNLSPKQKKSPEEKFREELVRQGLTDDRKKFDYIMRKRRGLDTKYGRDLVRKVMFSLHPNG